MALALRETKFSHIDTKLAFIRKQGDKKAKAGVMDTASETVPVSEGFT